MGAVIGDDRHRASALADPGLATAPDAAWTASASGRDAGGGEFDGNALTSVPVTVAYSNAAT